MKVSKAIEILEFYLKILPNLRSPDYADALKLGAEALKCVLKIRQHPFPDEIIQLRGETPDYDAT